MQIYPKRSNTLLLIHSSFGSMTTQIYNGLKGHQAPSQRHRPRYGGQRNTHPERAKAFRRLRDIAHTGFIYFLPHTQGVDLGYGKAALPRRSSKSRSYQGRAHSYFRNLNKIILFALFFIGTLSSSAKKVKVTIDGTVLPTQTRLYLIVNEDTANAQLVPIHNAKFSVTIKVERDAFIRLHDYKEWPERSAFVLIPDRKHITINWRTGSIEGSPMSKKLQIAMKQIRDTSPEGFHIDVFSDNPEDWARAQEQGNAIRAQMEMTQREIILQTISENWDNNIPAWVYYCYKSLIAGTPENLTSGTSAKWPKHSIIRRLAK